LGIPVIYRRHLVVVTLRLIRYFFPPLFPFFFLAQVFIEVLDENDHIPLTAEPVYWVHVAENSPPKTPVARITAIDGDRNSRLTYQLKAGNPQSLFDIDPNTGTYTPFFSFKS
jgi:hypothetical protein